jgi:hypothetical protein
MACGWARGFTASHSKTGTARAGFSTMPRRPMIETMGKSRIREEREKERQKAQ